MKTVHILGNDTFARHAPWDNPGKDHFWWLNAFHVQQPPEAMDVISAWFEMHTFRRMERRWQFRHMRWLRRNHSFPIYMRRKYEDVPKCVPYPLREVACLAPGVNFKTLFGCTHSYMLGLAILHGFKRIRLYGVNLMGVVETYLEKPSFQFWHGFAVAQGIEVDTTHSPYLMPEILYGIRGRSAPAHVPHSVRVYTYNVETYGSELEPVSVEEED